MGFNLVSSVFSSGLLLFCPGMPVWTLSIVIAILGLGMASVYATGLLWVEGHVTMTPRMISVLTVAEVIGLQVQKLCKM